MTPSPLPPFQPVVILGAGRSGTNMLRDILCTFPNFGTWPCDEINYIWRHGNTRFPHDEFAPAQATPKVSKYIQHAFARCAQRQGCHYVVEKTCANSLRPAFVAAALPSETQFIHIVRNGFDVAPSALKRWTAPLDLPYLMKKARFVPPSDLPYYALRYLAVRAHRIFDHEGRLGSWGPRYADLKKDLADKTLLEVCAWQWRRCVENSLRDLETLPTRQILHVRYETFVRHPTEALARIQNFLQQSWTSEQLKTARSMVKTGSLGRGEKSLSSQEHAQLNSIVSPLMEKLGALWPG